MTTARTVSSAPISSMACSSAPSMPSESALNEAGRFSVSVTAPRASRVASTKGMVASDTAARLTQ